MKYSYQSDFGLFWPDYDPKAAKAFEIVAKSLKYSDHAIRLSKRRVALQAGGHVGMWPIRLAKFYDHVVTCEPQHALFQCLIRNVDSVRSKVTAHNVALGAEVGNANMLMKKNPATWCIESAINPINGHKLAPVEMTTIDALKLEHLDALFLDIEGHESEALKGGRETIMRCKPVIQCELTPRARPALNAMLHEFNYRLDRVVERDGVYVPR